MRQFHHHEHHRRHFARPPEREGERGHGHGHGHKHREHELRDGDPREHRGRGLRRGNRLFDHGELRLVVLALIAEQPRHGYEIIKAIEERAAGTYSPSPGVIYPTLTMLEEIGHATVAESEGKKQYAITGEGRQFLETNKVAVDAALARMQAVANAHGGPAPAITRATENLKLALRLRMGRGPLTEEQARAIAAALDAAAVAIERS